MEPLSFWAYVALLAFQFWLIFTVAFFPFLAPALVFLVERWRRWSTDGRLRPLLRLSLASLFLGCSLVWMLMYCLDFLDRFDGSNPAYHAFAVYLAVWWSLFGLYLYLHRARLKGNPNERRR